MPISFLSALFGLWLFLFLFLMLLMPVYLPEVIEANPVSSLWPRLKRPMRPGSPRRSWPRPWLPSRPESRVVAIIVGTSRVTVRLIRIEVGTTALVSQLSSSSHLVFVIGVSCSVLFVGPVMLAETLGESGVL